MRRASILALCSLLLAGCASRSPRSGATDKDASPSAQPERTLPGPAQVIGRVIAVDPRTLFVMIEVAPYAIVPANFNERMLISRLPNLTPTARLQASAYLRGHILGARVLAGRPQVGDEVVFPPATL